MIDQCNFKITGTGQGNEVVSICLIATRVHCVQQTHTKSHLCTAMDLDIVPTSFNEKCVLEDNCVLYQAYKNSATGVSVKGEAVAIGRGIKLNPEAYIGTNIKEGTTEVTMHIQYSEMPFLYNLDAKPQKHKYLVVMWEDGEHHEVRFPIYLLEAEAQHD